MKRIIYLCFLVWMGHSVAALADGDLEADCAARLLETADDSMTVGEIRSACEQKTQLADADSRQGEGVSEAEPDDNALEARLESDRLLVQEKFNIMAHRPNYLLPAVYNFDGWDSSLYQNNVPGPDYTNDDLEAQFQVSVKVPLAIGLFNGKADFYAAYTNRSFWQAYNSDNSQPFRETNHEPEAWLQFSNDWQIAGFTNSINAFGYLHQSNGQRGVLSRGWDRVFANFIFSRNNLVLSFRPWIWVNSNDDDSDNPDIDEYMGHGEFTAIYAHKGNVFTVMARNQIESGFDRGALQLSWSFPLFDYPYLKGYLHYFYGYGESLIDYNQKVNSIGLGISITDWLK